MTVDEAVEYFSSGYDMCQKLGIKSQNFYKWKRAEWIPLKQQHRINRLVGGELIIDIDKESMEHRLAQVK